MPALGLRVDHALGKTATNLASNRGPHHVDLLDLREEGLGKLPAILEIVRSMEPISWRFTVIFTCDTMHVPHYNELFVTQY